MPICTSELFQCICFYLKVSLGLIEIRFDTRDTSFICCIKFLCSFSFGMIEWVLVLLLYLKFFYFIFISIPCQCRTPDEEVTALSFTVVSVTRPRIDPGFFSTGPEVDAWLGVVSSPVLMGCKMATINTQRVFLNQRIQGEHHTRKTTTGYTWPVACYHCHRCFCLNVCAARFTLMYLKIVAICTVALTLLYRSSKYKFETEKHN